MKSFQETNLNYNIIKALNDIGLKNPTQIQKKVIIHFLNSNQDLIALSQTGTGKTGAFGLPLINNINVLMIEIQGLIICPTRELCIQITKDLLNYAKYLSKINIISVYGGVNIHHQMKLLKKPVHIVIGTPGRIIDLIQRKSLQLHNIRYFILDEADEMLNMGFKEELDKIIKELPKKRQNFLFSATMSNNIMNIANHYLKNPKYITIGKKNIASDYINHFYYIIDNKNKYLVLKRIIDVNPNIYGIIFCSTKKNTQKISENLISDGYNVDAIYGDLSQNQREIVMKKFKEKKIKLLIATDIAARGIDVNNITHIINYNLPENSEIYIHRSGRTGRAKNYGNAISIINNIEFRKILNIQKKIDKKIYKLNIPNNQIIFENQILHITDQLKNIIDNQKNIDFNLYLDIIYKKLKNINKDEIIKSLLFLNIKKLIFNYKNYNNQNINNIKKINNKKLLYSKIFINLGLNDNINNIKLLNLIKKYINININNIIIYKKYSIFQINNKLKNKFIKKMNNVNYNGKEIYIK